MLLSILSGQNIVKSKYVLSSQVEAIKEYY